MSERNTTDAGASSEWLNPQEAAVILRVTDRTIQRYIKDGHLAATRLPGGRLWRIRRSDVEKLLTAEAAS
ncbi:helix-turn-helix domain-containing protein [Mycolicibacterium austroafricanum]|uniref:Helix-turn-helix domain-containing protein n=1 Tax=Mycolicibacterium austroafricanum TaxID=39687 RepID=A0ABT8HKW8_MYCAO|nr:helix-turn-helix domain-containing protein [Mycolicibacterium austroafricanum]MDN4521408.1 helix-turn-helix domain-containing protein [Mycolicibacterium austroafricanum]